MSDLKRWVDEIGGDEAERSLLETACDDDPHDGQTRHIWARLGPLIGAPGGPPPDAPPPAAPPPAPAEAAGPAAGAAGALGAKKALVASGLGKALVVGGLGASLAFGIYDAYAPPAAPPETHVATLAPPSNAPHLAHAEPKDTEATATPDAPPNTARLDVESPTPYASAPTPTPSGAISNLAPTAATAHPLAQTPPPTLAPLPSASHAPPAPLVLPAPLALPKPSAAAAAPPPPSVVSLLAPPSPPGFAAPAPPSPPSLAAPDLHTGADPPGPTASRAQSEAAGRLTEESRLVMRARNELRQGQAGTALQTLGELGRRFPSGALTHERAALEVQALMYAGRREQARDKARAFLTAHPASPLAPVVRQYTK